MTCLQITIAVSLALATSSHALAQTPPSPAQPASAAPLEVPPGYGDPLPRTRADWKQAHAALEAEVELAKHRVEAVRYSGTTWEEARVEEELEAREAALERFEKRTMSRSPGAIVMGASMMAVGLAGVWLAAMADMNRDGGVGGDRGKHFALGIAGGLFAAAGVPVIVLGARKTWKGPPADPTSSSSSVTLGAGRVDLVHSF